MSWGGIRNGAGRKPRAKKALSEAAEKSAQGIIQPWLQDLLTKLKELADGVLVAGKDDKVYRVPPDRGAIEYLINRLMGRPTERVEAEVTMERVEVLFELQARAEMEVMDDEFGREVSGRIRDRIQQRFAFLSVEGADQGRAISGPSTSCLGPGEPGHAEPPAEGVP